MQKVRAGAVSVARRDHAIAVKTILRRLGLARIDVECSDEHYVLTPDAGVIAAEVVERNVRQGTLLEFVRTWAISAGLIGTRRQM